MALVNQRASTNKSLQRLHSTLVGWTGFLAALIALVISPAHGQSKEYQVKAAFLLNFANFVQWPQPTVPGSTGPILIGVLGEDPFGRALEATIQGETVHGSNLAIERSGRPEVLTNCQVVFISKSEKTRIERVLPIFTAKPILVVSEIEGFAELGGVINFYREQGKVRFELNPAAAQRQGLKLSSELLNLGKIVTTTPTTK